MKNIAILESKKEFNEKIVNTFKLSRSKVCLCENLLDLYYVLFNSKEDIKLVIFGDINIDDFWYTGFELKQYKLSDEEKNKILELYNKSRLIALKEFVIIVLKKKGKNIPRFCFYTNGTTNLYYKYECRQIISRPSYIIDEFKKIMLENDVPVFFKNVGQYNANADFESALNYINNCLNN